MECNYPIRLRGILTVNVPMLILSTVSTFNIYISFSEDKEDISKWVIDVLTTHLETRGL